VVTLASRFESWRDGEILAAVFLRQAKQTLVLGPMTIETFDHQNRAFGVRSRFLMIARIFSRVAGQPFLIHLRETVTGATPA